MRLRHVQASRGRGMMAPGHPFVGDGEAVELARSLDWAATPLGPVESWSRTLRDTVRTCMASPFPILLWCGPELVCIYNDGYRWVLGDKHPGAMGAPGNEVWAEIWPQIEPWFEQIRQGGPPIYMDDAPFHIRRNGREADAGVPNAWFTFSLSPIRDPEGQLVAFMNIVAESTGRVLAEARLRDVFRQAPAFMAIVRGERHTFEYANRAYLQLVGHRDLVGRPVLEALPEIRGQGFAELLDEVLETGEPFVGREVAVLLQRTPDGPTEQRYVDFVYHPITEVGGARTGVFVHGSDVTDHVEARRQAQSARVEAEEANLAKSRFLATMSHEIRTPINAVMGYADLLDAGVAGSLTDKQEGYVGAIRGSSRHLLGLVSDVLDLAKIEAGELKVDLEEAGLESPISAALSLVAPQAEAKGLELVEEWECDRESRVVGDEHRIRQVLVNLLSNAIKFTDSGGRVTVRCAMEESAPGAAALPAMGPWLVLAVEDTGKGISRDQLERVFEPFVQTETGHTRSTGGTGLGLTISRRLARLMGGELTVRSEPGEGSTFVLWLPPAGQERVEPPSEPRAREAWPPPPDRRSGLAAAGRTLLAAIDRVEEEWVEQLRADPGFSDTPQVTRAQIADQTAELLASFAKILFILEEGGGDPGLLDDAEAILDLVARRHGHQRRRLGWTRTQVEREHRILADLLDTLLRRDAPKRTAANLQGARGVLEQLTHRARSRALSTHQGKD